MFPIDSRNLVSRNRDVNHLRPIKPVAQPTPLPRTHFQFSRRALLAFGVLLMLPWAIVAVILLRPSVGAPVAAPPPTAAPAPLPTAVAPEEQYLVRSGPWGDLQYSRLLIEPPDEFVSAAVDDDAPPHWVFPEYTRETLQKLWTSAGLTAEQRTALDQATQPRAGATGFELLPPPQLVFDLPAAARATIYAALSPFPENPAQNEPFRFRADSADEWLRDSDVPPATIALVQRFFYKRGTSLLFSDQAVINPLVPSRDERIKLMKALARKATLLVKIRVSPSSDIDAIADYWSEGTRRKGLHALLESISHRPQGTTIDILHLLPRFARANLFTYPNPATADESRNRDCHWTSLNFFNDIPDDRFMDVEFVKHTLETEYVPATGRPRLGDILAFTQPDGDVIHSCVFIAGDIVFTKNGGSEGAPWILMNLPDVLAFYPADPPLAVRAYRHKNL